MAFMDTVISTEYFFKAFYLYKMDENNMYKLININFLLNIMFS
jgi:hypothetical protein